jgi:phage-related protein
MSLSLPSLISTIQSVVGGFTNFVNSVGSSINSTVNTLGGLGQGILNGLMAFGALIWDSVIKAFQSLANGIYGALQWLYNGAKYIIDSLVYVLQNAWNWLVGVFNQLWNYLNTFFTSLANSVNSFLSSHVNNFRSKLKQMIVADMAIAGGFPALRNLPEKLTSLLSNTDDTEKSLKSYFMMIVGGVAAPFIGAFTGAIFGELIDALLPTTTAKVTIIPTHQVPAIVMSNLNITAPLLQPLPSPPTPYPQGNSVDAILGGSLGYGIVRTVLNVRGIYLDAGLRPSVKGQGFVEEPLSGDLEAQVVIGSGFIYAQLGG